MTSCQSGQTKRTTTAEEELVEAEEAALQSGSMAAVDDGSMGEAKNESGTAAALFTTNLTLVEITRAAILGCVCGVLVVGCLVVFLG